MSDETRFKDVWHDKENGGALVGTDHMGNLYDIARYKQMKTENLNEQEALNQSRIGEILID